MGGWGNEENMIRRKKKKKLGARSLVKGRRLVIKKWKGKRKGKYIFFFGREETFPHFFWKIGKSLSSLGQKMKIKKRSFFFFRFKSSKIKS